MSRQVPLDRALADVDRRYLRDLGAYGQAIEKRIDDQFPPDAEALAAFNLEQRKMHASLNGMGMNSADQTALQDENARLKAELEAMRAQLSATPPPPADEPKLVDYSAKEWTKAALEAEIDRVNGEDPDAKLSKGTKDEMSAALTAYFAE